MMSEPIGTNSARARFGTRGLLVRLAIVAILYTIGTTLPAAARVAKLKFTAIGQINGAPLGSFLTAGFMSNEVVDMTFEIEETTPDSDPTVGAGTYNDPSSLTTFVGQTSAATVSFVGFGFQLLNPTRLDPASAFIVPASGPNPSAQYIRDWDVFDLDPPISNVDSLFVVLAELPNVTIKNVPADGFAIRSPDSSGNTTDFIEMKPTITLEVGCGNGVVDAGETCDTLCCDSTCDNFAPFGTVCRPAAGACDVAETCSGVDDTCPPDDFVASGTLCRGVAGVCDVAESCTGTSAACPVDGFVSAGVVCRPAAGVCDNAESCTGTGPACPPDTLSQFTCGTICRPSVAACDPPEYCGSYAQTGNFDCPPDVNSCPTDTPTETPTDTPTNTPTDTPTQTPTNTPTQTPTVTTVSTSTPTDTPTSTPTKTPTPTRTPTNTPTPTPTPTPTGTVILGPICATGPGGLIPGYNNGSPKVDCMAEICSYAAPPAGVNLLHPPNTITCKEGDPACDFGPAGDGICTFKLSICFNVSDTRQQCVLPAKVTRIIFTGPSEPHPRNATDTANRDALEAALLTMPGASITLTPRRSVLFTPALTTSDICSAAALFNVPLRALRSGGFRQRLLTMRYRVYPNANLLGSDRDSLRLRCQP